MRVTVRGGQGPLRLEGRLRACDPAGIRLGRRGGEVALAADRIERIEGLPRGRWRGLLLGAAVWGAASYGLFDREKRPDTGLTAATFEGMLAGGTVGALFDLARQGAPELLYQRSETEGP